MVIEFSSQPLDLTSILWCLS